MAKRGRGLALLATLVGSACAERSSQVNFRIDEPRIVAVVGSPAEVHPGSSARYSVIVATPDGPAKEPAARWSLCRTPRALTENGAVSVACAVGRELPTEGAGANVETIIPDDACARFGPETSAGLRPTDPDLTGGYYQPVRAQLDAGVAVLRHRLRCALTDAPIDIAQDFERRYRSNTAPTIVAVSMHALGDVAELELPQADAEIEVELRLAEGASEAYVMYEAGKNALVTRSETLTASWFVTAGELERDVVELTGTRATNHWTMPSQPGPVWLWVVVRDERGGLAVGELTSSVQ